MRYHRALVAVAALVLGTGALQTANKRATFVLTDGERVSGEVVFHTEERTNIRRDKNQFNLEVGGPEERAIPVEQVILIEFVAGQPRPEELRAVPMEGHLLALRNGQTRSGKLVDFIGGDTVRWELPQGGTIDVPIDQVRRVYMQGDRARELYNFDERVTAGAGASPSTPTSDGNRTAAQRRAQEIASRMPTVATVAVPAGQAWTDTKINVRRNDVLVFVPSGRVFFLRDNEASATADGNPAHYNKIFPVPEAPVGALIGKVGEKGDVFAVGTLQTPIPMPATGRLFLGINDSQFDDNSGAFQVEIKANR